ncbi:thioredoxin domain-containing protein [Deinococcus taeanensis]|uniref:thioredoxin domain-containing protein n=1 Tax=Deinococcus taeanensis TaxID=2737050 RepID=UPI001CDB7702|nr:thioredoxin domain-containing protein [Deinococcus taeanensis]UBV43582.1 thioredoxin domain-containing protein [Deinococcus taeanensis]
MNRLGQESSPYLRQHAQNPVAWWPWGDAAFAAARERDVPVLLSVGYSTCHWCHVMAHESFEDDAVAAFMNAHFVNVKVDREERPDVDAVYMAATQAMTGHGGWPMTVFLTPDGAPFYAGTYFPPQDGHGLPSFMRVMASVDRAWREERHTLLGNAQALTEHVREASRPRPSDGEVGPQALERAVGNLRRVFDEPLGGFGGAPKFPAPTTLDFLLTRPDGRLMALHTLRRMLAGGLHDQLGGGFHRYSVDEAWRVPHFEKMLYDNAQLTRTLLRAYQVSGDEAFAQAARSTLAYLQREMLGPDGGFFSAQDADTQGVEGLTFTWTPAEVRAALSDEDGALLCRHLGIMDPGNFLDPHRPEAGRRSVLFVALPVPDLALEAQRTEAELGAHLDALKARLLAERHTRPQPGTDDKVLTSWNGLALAAFADAARILQDEAYLAVAQRNAQFVRTRLRRPDGTLHHTWGGGQARVEGLMEDHALYALGLIALFQADGNLEHLHWARDLWGVVRRDFWNEEAGVFMASGGRAQVLLARQAPGFDSAVLSDNAAGALLGVWMERYFGDAAAEALARRTVSAFRADMQAAVMGFGGLWQAAAFLNAPHAEVAIIGTSQERRALEQVVAGVFLPFVALTCTEEGGDLPVLQDRPGGGRAYVCVSRACDLPTTDAGVLRGQLLRLT